MNRKRTFFIALSLFAASVACAIPGLPTASVPTLVPTVDTGILSTMVAETVSAAIVLTEQAFPTPTVVPSSTPTLVPTISPTAEVIPPGIILTIQEDGSTLFVDERAGYQVTVPAGWLTVGVNKQEFLDAFTLPPEMQTFLLSIENKDPNTFRLFAVDALNGHYQDGFFTNMNYIWDEQNAALLQNNDGLKAGIAQLADAAPEPEILSTSNAATSSGISAVFIESKYTVKISSGQDIVILQKQAVFNAKTGTVSITVTTVEALKNNIFPVFDAMLETIKIATE